MPWANAQPPGYSGSGDEPAPQQRSTHNEDKPREGSEDCDGFKEPSKIKTRLDQSEPHTGDGRVDASDPKRSKSYELTIGWGSWRTTIFRYSVAVSPAQPKTT